MKGTTKHKTGGQRAIYYGDTGGSLRKESMLPEFGQKTDRLLQIPRIIRHNTQRIAVPADDGGGS
jgi:hypothetical protein